MVWPAVIAAAATLGAAYMNKPKDKSSKFAQMAYDEVAKVQTPDVESMKIKLQQFVQQGLMTPDEAEAALVETNAFDNVTGDAEAQGAQMAALHGLQDQYNNGGLTDIDRARTQTVLDEINNNQRGQDQAITEDAHRRGVSGSGLELAQRMMSQQSSADQAGRRGMDIAAMAQQAKMDALSQAGQLGGQIEGQRFGEQAQKAEAANAISKFNATNQQQVALSNMAARNAAQSVNLQEKQRVADANTMNENANRDRDAGLIQQHYESQLDRAKAVSNALNGQAQAAQNFSNNQTKWNGDLISGTNNAFSTYMDGQKKKPEADTFHAAKGGVVPGQAPFPGDDPRNDVVDAKLSPGEVVIPRSETQPEYDSFMSGLPRSEGKPSVDAVKTVLQALSEMGC